MLKTWNYNLIIKCHLSNHFITFYFKLFCVSLLTVANLKEGHRWKKEKNNFITLCSVEYVDCKWPQAKDNWFIYFSAYLLLFRRKPQRSGCRDLSRGLCLPMMLQLMGNYKFKRYNNFWPYVTIYTIIIIIIQLINLIILFQRKSSSLHCREGCASEKETILSCSLFWIMQKFFTVHKIDFYFYMFVQ